MELNLVDTVSPVSASFSPVELTAILKAMSSFSILYISHMYICKQMIDIIFCVLRLIKMI